MNDNTDRLLEAIEHPEHFSDDELAALLNDPDMRELYDLMSKTSDAIAETPAYDLDKEWDAFVGKYYSSEPVLQSLSDNDNSRVNPLPGNKANNKLSKKFILTFFNRHAAAVIALGIIASLAVVAATVGIRYTSKHTEPTPTEAVTVASPEIIKTEVVNVTDSSASEENKVVEVVTFKDESFESLINVICEYYGANSTFVNSSVKDLHLYYKWDQSLPLVEVVEELNNFEQINISLNDNMLTIK